MPAGDVRQRVQAQKASAHPDDGSHGVPLRLVELVCHPPAQHHHGQLSHMGSEAGLIIEIIKEHIGRCAPSTVSSQACT
jgi:hypothetical protein